MSKKRLFTLSLFLPLMALSGAAYAGSTIADRNYWPRDVHAQSQRGVKPQQESDWRRAQARATRTVVQPSAKPEVAPTWHYQGGPKLPAVYW